MTFNDWLAVAKLTDDPEGDFVGELQDLVFVQLHRPVEQNVAVHRKPKADVAIAQDGYEATDRRHIPVEHDVSHDRIEVTRWRSGHLIREQRRVDRAPMLVLAAAMMLVFPKPLVGCLVPDPVRF